MGAILAVALPGMARAQLADVGALSGAVFVGVARGMAWFDANGDGYPDLITADPGTGVIGPEYLFMNQGAGTFVMSQGTYGNIFGVAAADYDNDGDIDVFMSNGNSGGAGHRLLENDGLGSFVYAQVAAGLNDNTVQGRGAAWADYDGDGDLDLFVAAYTGSSKLFDNKGDKTFTVAAIPVLQVTAARIATWADYDNDGDPDLFIGRSNKPNLLLRNDGGSFVDVTPAALAISADCFGATWGDYDNDGDLDLYLNYYLSPGHLIRNDGGGAFSDVTASAGSLAGINDDGVGVAWGDMDNDGDLDLVRANDDAPPHQPVTGAVVIHRNDGGGVFSIAATPPNGTWWSTVLADYDGDGDLDVFAGNDGGKSTLFRNDQASGNHWMHIDLHGIISNRFGIGARVTVVAGGARQIREVVSGEGYVSSNSVTAEFGLGSSTVADSVIVHWPSGIVSYAPNVAADARYNLVEVSGNLTGVEDGPAARLQLAGAHPDPFQETTRIDFTLAQRAPVRLDILDVQGRRVASLVRGVREAGRHSATWDGRDAGGVRLGAGIYFAMLESSGQVRSRRLVLLP